MRDDRLTLTIIDGAESRTTTARRGATLAEALREAGRPLDFDCGGRGVCGRCVVPFAEPGEDWAPRRACQTRLERDGARADVSAIPRTAPEIAGESTSAASGEESRGALGLAVDLGTTTLVCGLVSPASGRILATETRRNPQIAFGRDVVSRIGAASRDAASAAAMRDGVRREIGRIAASLAGKIGAEPERIAEIAVAGNATMELLFAGRDVSPLAAAPFDVGERFFEPAPAEAFGDWGVAFAPGARVYLFPLFSAFVGGDILAGFCHLRRARGAADGAAAPRFAARPDT
ncbi:MAG: 2Fe-2S iron-sulfur cluster binding domain-containing protein, partial [Thermoguttaceae bacterium]|nr:2Fe-2S iron-sulfur cluster binding domain-containing protein [Thermoguttaceae bacterium]